VKDTQKLERAIAIRHMALKLIEKNGQWQNPRSGPELKIYDDGRFKVGFYVRPSEPIPCGLYTLDLWYKQPGKVLSLAWDSVGADPTIVSFKRGDWEMLFLSDAH